MEWYPLAVNPNYEITKTGIVRNKTTKHILATHPVNGYLRIELHENGNRHNYADHRLVAMQFIPNPENKAEVNHKDFNRSNNNVENLEWVTRQENVDHKIKGRGNTLYQTMVKNALNAVESNKKPVLQYDLQNNFLAEHCSMSEAERKTGVNRKSIRFCVRGERKSAGGFLWKLKESSTTIESKP